MTAGVILKRSERDMVSALRAFFLTYKGARIFE